MVGWLVGSRIVFVFCFCFCFSVFVSFLARWTDGKMDSSDVAEGSTSKTLQSVAISMSNIVLYALLAAALTRLKLVPTNVTECIGCVRSPYAVCLM